MKRDNNVECCRVIFMFGIVCIHAFSWCDNVYHTAWALSSPSLIGFILISAWFGIRFRWVKILNILFTVAICCFMSNAVFVLGDNTNGGGYRITSYWYVWAYMFLMLFSPIIDSFVDLCSDRTSLIRAFFSISFLVWGWSFIADIRPFSVDLPSVSGFGDCSAVVLLCLYIVVRIAKKLGWIAFLNQSNRMLWITFLVSGMFVAVGFRHTNSIFAFLYALSLFLLIRKIPLENCVGDFFSWLGPSMFSVYLLHMPFARYFAQVERTIYCYIGLPHFLCQILLALGVVIVAVILDLPRRSFLKWFSTLNFRSKSI